MIRFFAGAGVMAVVLCAACTGKDPYNPGTAIGTFHVTSTLTSSSCGAAPNPWEFDVKLSSDHNTLYWIQGGVPVSGTLDATSHVSMSATAQQTIYQANPQQNLGACTLTRSDSMALAVTGTPITAFTGTLSYTFAPTSDSDCSQAVGPDAYATLPCTVSYTLSGAETTAAPASPSSN
jgi:hypothetical protein